MFGNTFRCCDGIFTVSDHSLFKHLSQLVTCEGPDAFIEPSCCAALEGPSFLKKLAQSSTDDSDTVAWCQDLLDNAVHVIWATGGSLVPDVERREMIKRGSNLI